ncbi:MAG: PAS domain S-box protein [Cyanophyceae cyanobacterium]
MSKQTPSTVDSLNSKLMFAAHAACFVVLGISCLVLLGWLFDVAVLTSFLPERVTMAVSTAFSFISSSLFLGRYQHQVRHQSSRHRHLFPLVYALPAGVVFLSLLTLIQYTLNINLGIEEVLFRSSEAIAKTARGQMAPNTASNFLLWSAAVVLLTRQRYWAAQSLAYLVFLIAFLGLVGHAYDLTILYGIDSYTGMAIPTGINFVLLALALLGTYPERGWMRVITTDAAGGIMARTFLPIVLGMPVIVGWLVLLGLRHNFYGADFGIALRSIVEVLLLGWVVWWVARKLNELDRQQQQMTRALSASERRFRAIFNQTFQFIGLLTPQGLLLEVNQTALDFGGMQRSDVVGKPFWEAHWWRISRQAQERLQEAIAAAAQGNFVRYEVDVQGADQQIITIDFSLRPVGETDVNWLIAEGREITKMKQVEEQLRQSEERFRRAFDDAATGEALVAPDGRFLRVNRSLCELLGYDTKELLAKTFQDLTHPDDLDIDLAYVQQMLAGDIRTYQMEKRYIHKQGHLVWVLLNVSLVQNTEAQPLYFVSQIQDISQRKRVESQSENLVAELERSNSDLEEFASVVSHDLLAPLYKHQMLSDIFIEEYGEVLDFDGRDYVERMGRLTHRMQILIKDLLTFSRVATQVQPFATVNLNTIVREVVSDLGAEIAKTDGQVAVDELPTLEADALQMRQLFQNLLNNALKFHQPHVAPRIKIYQLPASPNSKFHSPDRCHIAIEDNGIGFNPQYHQKVFLPFHRLHSSSQYEGTGLGLAICRKIIARHRGDILAQSAPGQGTTIIFSLPLKQSEDHHQ